MKKTIIFAVLSAAFFSFTGAKASDIDIKGFLSNGAAAIEGIKEGVLTSDSPDIKSLAGIWSAEGSAVSFKSDNLLKKAGGAAAAGVIQNKIDPFFSKAGLDKAQLTINLDSTFSLKIRTLNIAGSLSRGPENTYVFTFKGLGKLPAGKFSSYISKTPSNLDVMFDAESLKKFISVISSISGSSALKAATGILNQYDGLCIGFRMVKSGDSSATKTDGKTTEKKSSDNLGNISTKLSKLKNMIKK